MSDNFQRLVKRRVSTISLLLPLLALGCGSDSAGVGTAAVTAYGEAFIEEGIPASVVEDGWAIKFERFEVSVRDVTVAQTQISVQNSVDLAKSSRGKGHELGSAEVPEGEHTGSSYTIAKVRIEGSAKKGDATKTFEWVFDDPTKYGECETVTRVSDGGTGSLQITVHADHLFHDSLVAEEPRVLFQALADADSDADSVITKTELAATDIGAYDPGSEGGVDDLWTWLALQIRTLGHVDGEGHCHAHAAD